MPGASGFDLLERLDPVPLVIFTTAYDQYAVQAFEVNALDYLLKPIAPERLSAALERVRQAWSRRPVPTAVPDPSPAHPTLERIFVREGDRCWIVRLADIRLMESEGNYTRLHFGCHRALVLKSLGALEARLDPSTFFRASARSSTSDGLGTWKAKSTQAWRSPCATVPKLRFPGAGQGCFAIALVFKFYRISR